jgi:hypothetical protein
MTDQKLLQEYPGKRIKAEDGLAVTAQVWEEAHSFHRQRQRLHTHLLHGVGIVCGLEVYASDPPDPIVHIMPGIAVDPQGEMIVVSDPVHYNLGPASGYVYLVLTYGESSPIRDTPVGPAYVSDQYSIEVSSQPEGHGGVVLARIRREREAPLSNPSNPELPGWNEIDPRFRRELKLAQPAAPASIAVVYPPGQGGMSGGHGAARLARALNLAGKSISIDEDVPLSTDLSRYDLVYFAARDAFQLSREQMNHLYTYLGQGGTVFMDCCLKEAESGAAAAASYMDLAASFGIELQEIQPGHALLSQPHLFGLPPAGCADMEQSRLLVGGGIFISEMDYGCLWNGERSSGPARREEIRSAEEWGENILAYAVQRKKEAQAG